MKRFWYIIIASAVLVSGCNMFESEIEYLRNNVKELQEQVDMMNRQLTSLQTIMQAIENNALIENVTPIKENGTEIGYVIEFSNGTDITTSHQCQP